MADEIRQELWAAKDAIAEEAGCDLDKLFQLLQEWQAKDKEGPPATKVMQDVPES